MVLLDFDSNNLGFGHSGMVRVGFGYFLCIASFIIRTIIRLLRLIPPIFYIYATTFQCATGAEGPQKQNTTHGNNSKTLNASIATRPSSFLPNTIITTKPARKPATRPVDTLSNLTTSRTFYPTYPHSACGTSTPPAPDHLGGDQASYQYQIYISVA